MSQDKREALWEIIYGSSYPWILDFAIRAEASAPWALNALEDRNRDVRPEMLMARLGLALGAVGHLLRDDQYFALADEVARRLGGQEQEHVFEMAREAHWEFERLLRKELDQ